MDRKGKQYAIYFNLSSIYNICEQYSSILSPLFITIKALLIGNKIQLAIYDYLGKLVLRKQIGIGGNKTKHKKIPHWHLN